MAEKKVIVQKGSSVLTYGKGIAHAGAILSAKDFSSQEVFDDLYEKAVAGKTEKVKVLEEPQSEVIEEPKPDEPEKTEDPVKKKAGRPRGATKKNDK